MGLEIGGVWGGPNLLLPITWEMRGGAGGGCRGSRTPQHSMKFVTVCVDVCGCVPLFFSVSHNVSKVKEVVSSPYLLGLNLRKLVGDRGLEPPTPCMSSKRIPFGCDSFPIYSHMLLPET